VPHLASKIIPNIPASNTNLGRENNGGLMVYTLVVVDRRWKWCLYGVCFAGDNGFTEVRLITTSPAPQGHAKASYSTIFTTIRVRYVCGCDGLAADGYNPFGNLSQSYSMWPVILTTYNLPPSLCMKESSFMLTLLIPDLKSPGKDIDVYLRPLIDDLKDL
nr:hypothetical protein [Tanacetum cinerariifolium]